jgi:hypothetical protein
MDTEPSLTPDRSPPTTTTKRPPPTSILELELKVRAARKQYKKHLAEGGTSDTFVLKEIVVAVPKKREPTLVQTLQSALTCRSVTSFLIEHFGAAELHKVLTAARSPSGLRGAHNLSILVKPRSKNGAMTDTPNIPPVDQPKNVAFTLAACLYRLVNTSCKTDEDIKTILKLDLLKHPEQVLTIPAYARALEMWAADRPVDGGGAEEEAADGAEKSTSEEESDGEAEGEKAPADDA